MKKIIKLLFMLVIFIAPVAVFADGTQTHFDEEVCVGNNQPVELHLGPMIAGRMLHQYISFVAAIFIFILAFKFMRGGALAWPIALIGFGALADALSGGIFPAHLGHFENIWIGSLIFSVSIIVSVAWMAKIFGVFKKK